MTNIQCMRLLLLVIPILVSRAVLAAPDGAALYAVKCGQCHDQGSDRAPAKSLLAILRPPEDIVYTLSVGSMRQQAAGLNADEIRAIAVHITGKEPSLLKERDALPNRCPTQQKVQLGSKDWNGWGRDLENSRYQPDPGISAETVPRLKLRWAFAYPGLTSLGQPVVAGNHVFITGRTGSVLALDADSGCWQWSYDAEAPVRAAPILATALVDGNERTVVYFGDEHANVHAIDATSGERLWIKQVDGHSLARITGSITWHDGRLYVPVSSMEEVAAGTNPKYPCCTFRGNVVALDAATGRQLWKQYTIEKTVKPFRINSAGTQMMGPAGAAVWSRPTVDVRRGLLYVATGDSYVEVKNDAANSILALDLRTGARRWRFQATRNDVWLYSCKAGKAEGNCPKRLGPDFDFGSSPILVTLSAGRQLLIAASKSGMLYALDPDRQGRVAWVSRVGRGGVQGGILWGPASDGDGVYVAISDVGTKDRAGPGGLVAVDAATGRIRWRTPGVPAACAWARMPCSSAQMAAVSLIPGIVFSGALDGHLRAYSIRDGSMVWDADTGKQVAALGGAQARGGTIEYGGQVIAGGTLFVASGGLYYPGNALLAFSVDEK